MTRPRGSGYWTDERILTALRRWNRLYGASPTVGDLRDAGEGWPSPSTVTHRYVRFKAALVAAGLLPAEPTYQPNLQYTDAQILDGLRRAWRKGVRTTTEYREGGFSPTLWTIEKRFRTWRLALQAAGLVKEP